MNTMTLDGWCKQEGMDTPMHIDAIHFHVSDECHLELEGAEEELQSTHAVEKFIDIDINTMELKTSSECGALSDCQFRVYINSTDHRGHFHLVGHRASDNSLVYSNAVMIDQLG